VFSAKLAGFKLGLDMLKRGGLWVGVGIPASSEGSIELNPWEFFQKGQIMTYSAVGNVQDMRELVDMAAAGQVKTHVGRTAALSELGDVFDDLEAGKYVGRGVLTDMTR
jgi:D-arabinose 1-dehydrogenase-like Zn-dependent alcohol dehydrogenase